MSITREQQVIAGVLGLGVAGCALGVLAPPEPAPHDSALNQLADLVRVASTAALVVTVLLGPGLALRAATRWRLGLGFLALPGLALLAVAGVAMWVLHDSIGPRHASALILGPPLAWAAWSVFRSGPEPLLNATERRALLVVSFVFGLAIARAIWSLGPQGELYAGMTSRTLEVGDRPDSRVSFHVVQLATHGTHPYSQRAGEYFFPWSFSTRGPVAGLASAPISVLAGGRPPVTLTDQHWVPFDSGGFMAYRIAMEAFACTAFLSLWELVRRIGGTAAAQLGVRLAATTPFLVHEVWFTWPKLLAASLVLLAAVCLIDRRPLRAGLLTSAGYLVHPMVLLSLPVLGLIALWPKGVRGLRQPRVRAAVLLIAGAAVGVVGWRVLNGTHHSQDLFFDYFTSASPVSDPSVGDWVHHRLRSLANTLVPLYLFAFERHNPSLNAIGGSSPGIVHFFFGYWTSLPFGAAIVFLPLLAASLWRAVVRWPWPVLATVVLPFVFFAVYWGNASTGLLREGLHIWVLTLIAVVALEQCAERFAWARSVPIRALLALRAVEVLAVAMVPTLVTTKRIVGSGLVVSDVAAVGGMVAFTYCLATSVWSFRPPAPEPESEVAIE